MGLQIRALGIALALWIVHSSSEGEKSTVTGFSQSLIYGLLPTLAFVIAVWLAARAGMGLGPIILTGYAVWAMGSVLLYLIRRLLL